jgi:hypothetical protein
MVVVAAAVVVPLLRMAIQFHSFSCKVLLPSFLSACLTAGGRIVVLGIRAEDFAPWGLLCTEKRSGYAALATTAGS